MSKKIKSLILASILVFPSTFTLAQTSTNSPKDRPVVNAVRQEIKERVASTTEKMREKMDQVRETFLKIARERLQKIINRFEATVAREENISLRIISRIEKIKSAGGNTTEAENFVAKAKVSIDAAKTALTSLKNASSTAAENIVDSNISTSTAAKNGLKKIRDLALTVEKNLRDAHSALVSAVKSLKGMSSTATTTPKSN